MESENLESEKLMQTESAAGPSEYYCQQVQHPEQPSTSFHGLDSNISASLPSIGIGQDGKELCASIQDKSQSEIPCNLSEMDFPSELNVLKFAECRANEISLLLKEVEVKYPKLGTQQLPRHMRRRATSHKANRVPRRLRQRALRELEIKKIKKTKCPSRKHRRRPSNLLTEYNRRQRKHVWLETHIWFAKRFNMTQLWGYKLPLYCNEKSVKASYRASAFHVLLQDLSYYSCIELLGPYDVLLNGLSKITNPETGLTFAAKAYCTGSREGKTIIYHPGQYPYQAIGQVSFLWKPCTSMKYHVEEVEAKRQEGTDSTVRQLWIWSHPSCYSELCQVLTDVFNLNLVAASASVSTITTATTEKEDISELATPILENNQNSNVSSKEMTKSSASTNPQSKIKRKKGIKRKLEEEEKESNAKRRKYFDRITVYSAEAVTMVLLKDTLVRHRLIGPLAQAVITNALQIKNTQNQKADKATISSDENSSVCLKDFTQNWWQNYYADPRASELLTKQKKLWDSLKGAQTPSHLQDGTVIGLTVADPRLNLPQKRIKIMNDPQRVWQESGMFSQQQAPEIALSPIWDPKIRDEVTTTKIPESVLNKMRSQFLVPGSGLDLGDRESRIPVLVIQQPGTEGYGSGWDLIAPAGWGMPFWIAFMYRGTRAIGLREQKRIACEARTPLFPFNYPDTQSGRLFDEDTYQKAMAKHMKYPPDKRPSFAKLGISAPFCFPWAELVTEWNLEYTKKEIDAIMTDFSSLHCKESETEKFESEDKSSGTVATGFSSQTNVENTNELYFVLRNRRILRKIQEINVCCSKNHHQNKRHISQMNPEKLLIDIHNIIRDPTTSHIKKGLILVHIDYLRKGNPSEFSMICLPTKEDLENLRKNTEYSEIKEPVHKVQRPPIIEKKKKKKKKSKNKKDSAFDDSQISNNVKETKNTEVHFEKPKIDNLINSCSKQIIGYVQTGSYSFLKAHGSGLGFCALLGLIELFRLCAQCKLEPVVLVRPENVFCYRYARLHTLL